MAQVESRNASASMRVLLAMSLLAGAAVSAGQDGVTIEHVIGLAKQRAPAIAAAQGRVVQAEGRKLSASVLPDPAVTWGFGEGESLETGETDDEWSLEVEQFFRFPGNLRGWKKWGIADIEASQFDLQGVTADVVLQVRRLYYEAAIGQAEAQAFAEAAKDAQSLRDIVGRRVDLGEASEADRLRTNVETLRAELDARRALAESEAARVALDKFLLGALGPSFTLTTALDPTRQSPVPQDAAQRIAEQNPEYRAAQRRVEAGEWALSAERASRLPGLAVSLFHEEEIDRDGSGFTLGLAIPLWNRNQGGVRAAEGELAERQAEAVRLKAALEAEFERLIRAERSAKEVAISYRREILPAATQTLSIMRFSLEQGEASLLAWLEARRSYLEILRISYQAELAALMRRAELDRLMGVTDVP